MNTEIQEVKPGTSQMTIIVELGDIGTMRAIAEEAAGFIRANCKHNKARAELLGSLNDAINMYIEIEYRAKNNLPTVW